MQPRRPYPGIGHAVLMTLGFIALTFVFGMPLAIGAMLLNGGGTAALDAFARTPYFVIIVNSLACAVILCWGYAANRVPWRVLLPFRRVSVGALLAVVITSAGLSATISEVDNLFRTVVPMSEAFREMLGGFINLDTYPWSTVVALVIVAPMTEETMIRGVMLRGLLARCRPVVAVLVSAVLFGFAHLNPWQFVSATLLGMAYGWWYLRTRSLLPSLLGHAINNGIVALLMLYQPDIPGYSGEFTTTVVHQPWWFTLGGVALTGLGLWWFARSTAGGPPPEPVEETPAGPQPPPLPMHPLQYALAPLPVETTVAAPAEERSDGPPA